jgi:hypothetical protein
MDGSDHGTQPVAAGGDLPKLPNADIPDDLEQPEDFDDGSEPTTEPPEEEPE